MIWRLALLILVVVVLLRLVLRPRANLPVAWDPWAVLGIRRDASHDEIAHAYREQMKRYHPDRVADLGDELRNMAHQKAIDIQRAYTELGGT